MKYMNKLLRMSQSPYLIKKKVFPNVKEVTESFSAYDAVKAHLWDKGFDPKDPNVTVICVGDGHQPRTALTFALQSRWRVYSVDPELRERDFSEVPKLKLIKSKIECIAPIYDRNIIIVAVHSHAKFSDTIEKACASERLAAVAIPCCVKHDCDWNLIAEYRDEECLSPENLVKVWLRQSG